MQDHKEFTVGGKRILLSFRQVEETLEEIQPEPVKKHYVLVKGRKFPVKQALRAVANLPRARFISTEAVRVFRSLGFEVGREGETPVAAKNQSEILFEQYLEANGLGHYQFEPTLSGTEKRPDYLLRFAHQEIVFDVKEFRATPDDFKTGYGAYDPYGPIREKIQAGWRKFKDMERYACCLVLYNEEKPLVDLSWTLVYGAMLGNLAIQMPFDRKEGRLRSENAVQGFFGGGGKMLRYTDKVPYSAQNTTISAILVLDRLHLGRRRFQVEVAQREKQLGRDFMLEEFLAMTEELRGTEKDTGLLQLRVVVHENPFARIPLTRDIFSGPFDERYGPSEDRVVRVFAGHQILKLEAEENEVGLSASPVRRRILGSSAQPCVAREDREIKPRGE